MNRFVTLAGERIGDLVGHAAESGRLARGRSLFRKGAVSDLTVTSGTISALVKGSSGNFYETTVAASLATPGTIREVAEGYDPSDRHSIADLLDNGVRIVPRVTDLAFSCTCPDWEEPCKHAIAVLFAMADRVDLDEVDLLRWRGIDYSASTAGEGAELGSTGGLGSLSERNGDEAVGDDGDEAVGDDGNGAVSNADRAAAVEGLRELLGETAPAFGRRRSRRSRTAVRPNSPALAAFLGEPGDLPDLDVSSLVAAPPLVADAEGGALGDLGPQLSAAIDIIVNAMTDEQAERE